MGKRHKMIMAWKELRQEKRMKSGPIERFLHSQSQGRLLEEVTSQLGTEGWVGVIQTTLIIGREGESVILTTTLWSTCDTSIFPVGYRASQELKKKVTRVLKSSQGWMWGWSARQLKPKSGLVPCATPGLSSSPAPSPQRSTWQDKIACLERRAGQCWAVRILWLSSKTPDKGILQVTSEFLNVRCPQGKS